MDTSVATLIANAERGDTAAVDALFSLLYGELHRLAKSQIARSFGNVTIGTTTLLHEAYLDMAAREQAVFPDRSRFMGYAARAMRTLIIDHARGRDAQKRGGEFSFTPLHEGLADRPVEASELERVGLALDELSTLEPRLAQVVDLNFFCGFSFAEIAAMWGASERTVQRDWEKARIFLRSRISGSSI
jgi:RNA polymerase sigma factor (TIGR02999 family)